MKLCSILVAVGLVSACGWQDSPCGPGGVEEARMRLLATDVEFARVAHEQGLPAAFSAFLADDAVYLPMNFPAIYGTGDAAGFVAGNDGIRVAWTPADADVAQSCDIGYTFGSWHAQGTDADGAALDVRGKYLGVWRLEAETGWKVVVYMQNGTAQGNE